MGCAPADPPVRAGGTVLGAVLLLATLLVPLPQLLKLKSAQASSGLSPKTLALATLFSAANFGAVSSGS